MLDSCSAVNAAPLNVSKSPLSQPGSKTLQAASGETIVHHGTRRTTYRWGNSGMITEMAEDAAEVSHVIWSVARLVDAGMTAVMSPSGAALFRMKSETNLQQILNHFACPGSVEPVIRRHDVFWLQADVVAEEEKADLKVYAMSETVNPKSEDKEIFMEDPP